MFMMIEPMPCPVCKRKYDLKPWRIFRGKPMRICQECIENEDIHDNRYYEAVYEQAFIDALFESKDAIEDLLDKNI